MADKLGIFEESESQTGRGLDNPSLFRVILGVKSCEDHHGRKIKSTKRQKKKHHTGFYTEFDPFFSFHLNAKDIGQLSFDFKKGAGELHQHRQFLKTTLEDSTSCMTGISQPKIIFS